MQTRTHWTPALLASFLLTLAACGVGGGGGEEAAGGTLTDPILLLETTVTRKRGSRALFDQMVFTVEQSEDPMGSPVNEIFDDRPFGASDVGRPRTYDSSSGEVFERFAALSSNGANDHLRFLFRMVGGGGSGTGNPESNVWEGGFDGTLDPDANGYVITRVEMEVIRAAFVSPGDDPFDDGNWTDTDIEIEIRVYGYRE